MKNKFWKLKQLNGFDNIVITDENGIMMYYDCVDLDVLKFLELHPDKIIGYKATSRYRNLTDENSILMKVIKTGIPICVDSQELITQSGKHILSKNSTYPIIEDNKVTGAIEFSKYFYAKGNVSILDSYFEHKSNIKYTVDNIITENKKMIDIKSRITRIAKTKSSVLIYGETGTGKELVAKTIHNLSERCNEPFVCQNCGTIPTKLLESILFGTEKGSFSVSQDVMGVFEQANGGTLFLDEINALDVSLQVKLLKVTEEKSIRRIGGDKNIPLDIRIIAATNEPPKKLVDDGKMRADLFYRLGVVEINLPTLSERKEDINGLVKFFIELYNNNMNIQIDDVDTEVLECFYKYNWPGNIRELKNAIETAYNNATTSQITINDIPEQIRKYNNNLIINDVVNIATNGKEKFLKRSIEEYEKRIILDELKNTNNNVSQTARILGVSKQLLEHKISKYMLS